MKKKLTLKKIRNVEENKKAKDKILLSGIILALVIPNIITLTILLLFDKAFIAIALIVGVIPQLIGARQLYLLLGRTNFNVRDLENEVTKGSKRDFEEENESIMFGL